MGQLILKPNILKGKKAAGCSHHEFTKWKSVLTKPSFRPGTGRVPQVPIPGPTPSQTYLKPGDRTEHPPSRPADGTKPGGQPDPPGGCAPSQDFIWRRGLTQTPRSPTKGNAKSCSSTEWGQLARKQLCRQGAGILAHGLSTSQHRALAAPMTASRLGCCRRVLPTGQGRPCFRMLLQGQFCFKFVIGNRYCVQPWALQHKENMDLLERVQRRAMKMSKGLSTCAAETG